MDNIKENIKVYLIVLFVLVLIFLFILFFNKKSNFEKLEEVNNFEEYFSCNKYINNYLINIASKNTDAVYDILDYDFKFSNEINYNNLDEKLNNNYSLNCNMKINKLSKFKLKNNTIYYVSGIIVENNYDNVKIMNDKFSILILMDYNNYTYSLYPINNDNIKKIVNQIKKINISKNKNNIIDNVTFVGNDEICNFYFSDFLNHLNDTDYIYNLLDNEMKKIFTTKDELSDFIKNNYDSFSFKIDKYKVDKLKKETIYTILDTNKNKYEFIVQNITNYKVRFNLKK